MIRRIDLFMPPFSRYEVLHRFTRDLYEAFLRAGVEARLLEWDPAHLNKFIDTILESPPDCTLSFNGLLPDNKGEFLCDFIKIPHIACLVDAPFSFVKLIKSPRTIVTCVDKFHCQFFKGLGMERVLFMPHAVDSSLHTENFSDEPREKKYDVVLLASFRDPEKIYRNWKDKYPKAVSEALNSAAVKALYNTSKSYVEYFVEAFNEKLKLIGGVDPKEIDFIAILQDLEDYVSAKDRVELIQNISEVQVDIFGEGDGEDTWQKCFAKKSNVNVHAPISYIEAIEVMKQSHIVLNSSPKMRQGAHERIFGGLNCGAFVISSESLYLQENFQENEGLYFYKFKEDINNKIISILNNKEKFSLDIKKGQETIKQNHLWDNRAAYLLKEVQL